MAKNDPPAVAALTRFHVKSKCFVNGSLIDPNDPIHGGKPVYVMLPAEMKSDHLVPPNADKPDPPLPTQPPMFSSSTPVVRPSPGNPAPTQIVPTPGGSSTEPSSGSTPAA